MFWSGVVMLVLGVGAVAFGVWRIDWDTERGRPHEGWVRGTWAVAGGVFAVGIGVVRLGRARRLRREEALRDAGEDEEATTP